MYMKCKDCNGMGDVKLVRRVVTGVQVYRIVECTKCGGTGRLKAPEENLDTNASGDGE